MNKPLAARPSHVRYVVVATTALMAVLLYLDRFCISFAEVFIKEDLGLTDRQTGLMLGCFFGSYALGQVPAGWLTDRFGSRIMLTTYVLMWSLFTALTGLAFGFVMLIILRLGFGFAQAGAYPTGASIVSKWVPFETRGVASSVVSMGGRVGGWLALYATGFVIVWLTPATTPVNVTRADILDGTVLCKSLVERGGELDEATAATRQHVWDALPEVEQAMVQSVATNDGAETVRLEPLLALFNRAIDQPDFFPEEMLKGLPLEREAVRSLATDPATRTMRQSQRNNRLVLEAVYPGAVKKLYSAGWRPMMFVYGALGLLVAALSWMNCRNHPEAHPRCNAEEVALINRDPRMTARGGGRATGVPLLQLVCSFSMWCSCASQWFTNVGWVFVMTWAPRYFHDVHQVPVEQRALMVSIPPLVGWAGMMLGGVLTDYLARKIGVRWGRALPMSLTRFLAMAAYVICLWHPSPWTVVFLLSVVTFSTDLGTASVWAFCQDVGGKQVGSILGWGNMWGNLGAMVTPSLLIWIVGEGVNKNWDRAFMVCAAAFLISGIAALGVNATIPIAQDPIAQDPISADEESAGPG